VGVFAREGDRGANLGPDEGSRRTPHMADVYKGLTIQFGADTKGLSAALRDINKESRGITSELKKVENEMKRHSVGQKEENQRIQSQVSNLKAEKTSLDM
jgi:phage-related minor tail protein